MAPAPATAVELRAQMAQGALSPVAVVRAALDRIAARDAAIHAFLEVDAAGALRRAEELEASRRAGTPPGPLFGVPVALKDNLAVAGWTTTCGSRILAGYQAAATATAVQRLLDAGAVLIGRTNMDEFAMGSSTENSAYGPTHNPWRRGMAPGGSSGGSAAAVAAGMVPLALGSDTGGSIRQPAALCGILGLKPTWGRVSRSGLVAFASSLDQIGPMARSAADLALALQVLAGPDPLDATALSAPVPDYRAALAQGAQGLRIGVPAEYFPEQLRPDVRAPVEAALRQLAAHGATLVPIRLPSTALAIPTYYLIATAEASSNLARFDGVRYGLRAEHGGDLGRLYSATRAQGFGAEVKRRILLGTFCLSAGYAEAWYGKAQKVRAHIGSEFAAAFQDVDVIAGPTSPIPAFPLGEKSGDPLAMYLCDVYSAPANLAGLPGVSVPCGFSAEGLPVGLQILAPALGEPQLLRAAAAVEAVCDAARKEPPP
jgi:aspartyl-tRNA(Asn)/glutamyl-tRNA(Gln) amidotransferase subunit A